ncbi:MAG: glycosyltransferase family 1 protein [Flavobacterium psychrophilum]|nr:MAG: glycosyltransferase family 1 protein [Flavobacterium psychrophilum]
MKIAILGTRGIPNLYGGFEQFAEYIAPALAQRGHEVFVYCSSLHPYEQPTWKGVQLIKKKDPENKIGTFGQFIYDLNCILDSRTRQFDVILQLGYTSSSVWSFLFPKKSVIVTNMDGLEWKRTKYSKLVQSFLKRAEKWAAFKSNYLISDSKGIQAYLLEKYNKSSVFIAYGATLFEQPDNSYLNSFNLAPYSYNMIIARMEPENNVETILQGHQEAQIDQKLIVIGNYKNKFGTYLKEKYTSSRIEFIGPVYDITILNNLRHFSHLYFHGHSVGGTNPSLLEAMASQALVVAHDNIFNKSVLEQDAFYFSTPADIRALLEKGIEKSQYESYITRNNQKITNLYSWTYITDLVEKCLTDAIHSQAK